MMSLISGLFSCRQLISIRTVLYAIESWNYVAFVVLILCTELAKGDSLAAFYWNTGGTWSNRSWDQDLPTDSQVS